jgi:hypothetical protein
LFPLFATGVIDTAWWQICNPTVSTTLAKLVAQFSAVVVDTGGKFAAGVVDACGNFAPVLLIPVVQLDLRISPRIFEKI